MAVLQMRLAGRDALCDLAVAQRVVSGLRRGFSLSVPVVDSQDHSHSENREGYVDQSMAAP